MTSSSAIQFVLWFGKCQRVRIIMLFLEDRKRKHKRWLDIMIRVYYIWSLCAFINMTWKWKERKFEFYMYKKGKSYIKITKKKDHKKITYMVAVWSFQSFSWPCWCIDLWSRGIILPSKICFTCIKKADLQYNEFSGQIWQPLI